MDWREEGTLLAVRTHGESAAIIEVFTETHGRHAGVVRGGAGRRMSPVLQPGAQLALAWRARLEDHIGAFTVEPVRARAPAVMGDRTTLLALSSVCALLAFALPERQAHPRLYHETLAVLDALVAGPGWGAAYLGWERALLGEMGFGLDLERCAVTGVREGLAYVSPRSGRAVSVAGAGEWAARLLPLPPGMLGEAPMSGAELAAALAVTGHFLEHHLAPSVGDRPLPAARTRLVDALRRGG
jgi:DNA repair protein RecO (recombination protein O)